MSNEPVIDFSELPSVADDGHYHINTLGKPKTTLGEILRLNHEIGEALNHPSLGPFRTVENVCCYLNTGGSRDNIRTMKPHSAINTSKLYPAYTCDKFRDLILDFTLLKLMTRGSYVEMMVENNLPFDHYYVVRESGLTVRPNRAQLLVSVFNDVRKILRGEMNHRQVRLSDMKFRPLK